MSVLLGCFVRLCYICQAKKRHAMITFTLCLLALVVGYFTYGRLMERVFGPDDRKTPALTKAEWSGLYSIANLEDFH